VSSLKAAYAERFLPRSQVNDRRTCSLKVVELEALETRFSTGVDQYPMLPAMKRCDGVVEFLNPLARGIRDGPLR
jgi:hypothetical protein